MPVLKSAKHEIFAQSVASGADKQDAAIAAGYSEKSAPQQASYLVKKSEILARISEIKQVITTQAQWDAAKVLIRLGEQADADILDIQGDDGRFKPLEQWPPIWRKMVQGIDIEETFERSKDGGDASWDKSGQIVKIKFVDRLKNLELIGRHKAVDAFVQQKAGDVNLLVLSAERAREVDGARRRMQRVINLPTTPVKDQRVSELLPQETPATEAGSGLDNE